MEKSNKWLAILIVLVAIGLVVDLLSLNVLYTLANSKSNSNTGQLASYDAYSYSGRGQNPCTLCSKAEAKCRRNCDRNNPVQTCYEGCSSTRKSCDYDNGC